MFHRFSHHHKPIFHVVNHLFQHDSGFGRFLANLYCKLYPQPEPVPEPEPDPEPQAPSLLDLSSLDALIGTNADDVDEAVIQDTSGDDYTALMYEQGMLIPITDGNNIITGFEFTAPDGIELNVIGTIGGDIITTDAGDNEINARAGNDTVYAGEGNDTIHGGDGSDTLYGGNGNDMLYGDAGNDSLYGEAGDDILSGGASLDNLYGGAGADTFQFTQSGSGIFDRIQDFNAAEGDKIDISDLLSAYDPLTDAIEDFVQITDSGANSTIAVDVDGGGDSFTTVAIVVNTTGITDEQVLVDDGTLIV